MDTTMLARNWWVIALRGGLAILFGLLTPLMPGLTLFALVLLFGSYAILEGALAIIAAVRGRRSGGVFWVLLLEGVVSLAAGVTTFVFPGLTALVLLYVIAAWAIVTGALEIAAALRLRRVIRTEWWLALSGALSIVFGVLVMRFPGAGALAIVLWLGAYAIVFGALLIGVALRLRAMTGEVRAVMSRAA